MSSDYLFAHSLSLTNPAPPPPKVTGLTAVHLLLSLSSSSSSTLLLIILEKLEKKKIWLLLIIIFYVAATGSLLHSMSRFRLAADPQTDPDDLSRPGHILPLRCRPGGVLKRAGHTEASVDIARRWQARSSLCGQLRARSNA